MTDVRRVSKKARPPRSGQAAKEAHRIASVEVDELFGLYSYKIAVPGTDHRREPSLLLLYGDNGSGKTTILQLIYHLLAKEDNRGHRTYIAKTPFRRLRISLDPATVVEATRTGAVLVGDYRIRISRDGTQVVEADAEVDENLAIPQQEQRSPEKRRRWRQFLEALAELNLSFFFLRDDRRADPNDAGGPTISAAGTFFADELVNPRIVRVSREQPEDRLQETIDGLETWIRDEALRGANISEAGTRDLYADVAKRIAESGQPGRTERVDAAGLVESLHALERRSGAFVDLGLASPPHLDEIVRILNSSSGSTRSLIGRVITPYVDSLKARLDAQEELMELVTLFLRRLNRFLRDKTVTYELANGFAIKAASGLPLAASQLSSGERQLFALLAQVIVARSKASVFLIDEPEISLNVKWQRTLVDTLLQLVRGTQVQFILATHSLELLATHREHVYRLGQEAADD
jgi:energy-coupling factor transporter ATP-binding protein EcfA2